MFKLGDLLSTKLYQSSSISLIDESGKHFIRFYNQYDLNGNKTAKVAAVHCTHKDAFQKVGHYGFDYQVRVFCNKKDFGLIAAKTSELLQDVLGLVLRESDQERVVAASDKNSIGNIGRKTKDAQERGKQREGK